jgi:plastocyanin
MMSPAPGGSTNTVTVGNNFFSPTSLSVATGATVTWQWAQGDVLHNVTFDDGAPSSGPKSTGTFQRTFATAGTYTYFCSIHGRQVMSGSVTVGSSGSGSGSSGSSGSGSGGSGGTGGGGGGGSYGMP